MTPLHGAVADGDVATVRGLLKCGTPHTDGVDEFVRAMISLVFFD